MGKQILKWSNFVEKKDYAISKDEIYREAR